MTSSDSKSFTETIRQQRSNDLAATERMLGAVLNVFKGTGIDEIQIDGTTIGTRTQEDLEQEASEAATIDALMNCYLVRVERSGGIPLFGSRDSWTDAEAAQKIDLSLIEKVAPHATIREHVGREINCHDALIIAVHKDHEDEFNRLLDCQQPIILPSFKYKATIAFSAGPLLPDYFSTIAAAVQHHEACWRDVEEAAEKSYVLSQLRQAGKHIILAHDTGKAQQFGLPASIIDEVDKWDSLFSAAKAAEKAAKKNRDKAYEQERKARQSLWISV